jgi:hypothetical protein
MGMIGGVIRTSDSLNAKAEYPYQGIATADEELKTIRLAQPDATEMVLTFGTGESNADRATFSTRAIPALSSVTYDLYTGTDLLDMGGFTCAFRRIRLVYIRVISGGTSSGVRIGGAASDEFVGYFAASGDKHDIFPGGPAYKGGSPAGKTCSASLKNLKIENLGSAEVVVRIVIAGTTFVSGESMGVLGLTYP